MARRGQPLHGSAREARLQRADGVSHVRVRGHRRAQSCRRRRRALTRSACRNRIMSAEPIVPRAASALRRPPVAIAFLGLMLFAAVAATLIAPYAFDALDLAHRRAAPSSTHWFGTDELGRDLFTRVLFGARVSLAIGVLSACVSAALGL